MRIPFPTRAAARHDLEPAVSPLLPLSCLLAIAVAIGVVDAQLGSRLALISAALAGVTVATRLPRVLPVTALLCLVIAEIAVLGNPASAPVAAAHVAVRATRGR